MVLAEGAANRANKIPVSGTIGALAKIAESTAIPLAAAGGSQAIRAPEQVGSRCLRLHGEADRLTDLDSANTPGN